MAEHSAIQWTDATWNVVTGCTKVSPACAHCYIDRTPPFRIAGRHFVNGHIPLQFHEDRLTWPRGWRKPRRVFVNSLSDLFHEDVPLEFLHKVYHAMEHAFWHQFQVLTKRPARMQRYLNWRYGEHRIPSRHIWHGVSVENQRWADLRIPLLLDTRCSVRFISAEPLLGPLDLREYLPDPLDGAVHLDGKDLPPLDWVIAGAESGPKLRPTDPEWIRSLRDQCEATGTPFFFKQWGGRTAKAGGRVLDGREWNEFPGETA